MRVWELIQILEGFNQELEVCVDKGSHKGFLAEKEIEVNDDFVILGWEG